MNGRPTVMRALFVVSGRPIGRHNKWDQRLVWGNEEEVALLRPVNHPGCTCSCSQPKTTDSHCVRNETPNLLRSPACGREVARTRPNDSSGPRANICVGHPVKLLLTAPARFEGSALQAQPGGS